MTEAEIKEGQNIILEFLGYKLIVKYWIKDNRRFSGVNIISDWNYLMKVVDCICDYESVGDFEICNSLVQIIAAIEVDEPINDILINHSGGDDKIRAAFEACVKFIKQIK